MTFTLRPSTDEDVLRVINEQRAELILDLRTQIDEQRAFVERMIERSERIDALIEKLEAAL